MWICEYIYIYIYIMNLLNYILFLLKKDIKIFYLFKIQLKKYLNYNYIILNKNL